MTLTDTLSLAAKTAVIAAATVLAASCNKEVPGDALASVGNATLTLRQLRDAMPGGLTEADSAAFAESYISSWISDRLVTEVAAKNLPDTREIDKMAEDYWRNLIMWEYLRLKTAEDPSLAVNPDSVKAYFERNSSEFVTTEPLVRGTYVRIASGSPVLTEVKRLYRSDSQRDFDKLEKACMKDPEITLDYFRDKWVPLSQIHSTLPPGTETGTPAPGRNIEAEAGGFHHLLHISQTLPTGSKMPEEVAAPLIARRIEARMRTGIEQRLRNELLQKATADGTLKIYDRH